MYHMVPLQSILLICAKKEKKIKFLVSHSYMFQPQGSKVNTPMGAKISFVGM